MRVSGPDADETVRAILNGAPDGAEVIVDQGVAFQAGPALRQAVIDAADLPAILGDWWQAATVHGVFAPFMALILAAAIMAAAYAVERGVAAAIAAPGAGRVGVAAGWRWGARQVIRLALFALVSAEVITAVAGGDLIAATLGAALLAAVMRFRIQTSIINFLAAPGDAPRRVTGLTDAEAALIWRAVVILMIVSAGIAFVNTLVADVIAAGPAGVGAQIVLRILGGVAAIAFFIAVRVPVARILVLAFVPHAAPERLSRRLLARWHLFYAVLMALTVISDAFGFLFPALANTDAASSYSFLVFVLTPFVMAGIGLWRATALAAAPEDKRSVVTGVFALIEGAALLVAALLLLRAWDIDPFAADAGRFLPALVSASLVVVFGISAWRTAKALLSIYAPKLKDNPAEGAIPDGEGSVGGSRLETIYPILRVTLAGVIGTMTVLLALAALGVNIAPLIAGAGVFGLAVGFGAQTLVKDIISGMFYLYEDAFRVGEFIETDEGKGAVEKILLRSVRLRHPRGAIYTVPFGSMGTIKNHSRDWVTTKVSFDVAPTEDLERIRKLVKKVGVKLAADPELEGKFIEPLKSQGAIAMSASNYSVGVKFTCAPGQQFLIRRKAYAALQDMFAANDITLATPRVVVNSPAAAAAASVTGAAG
jgi:small-conductance mechanosensitive channel